jgi:cytochrome c oxidase subunit 2
MRFIGDILQKLFGFSLPEQASKNAYMVDDLYNFIMLLSIVGFIGLMAGMTYFIIRYHRTQNEKSAYIPHNAMAETLWTVIPTIIFVGIGIWGMTAFIAKDKPDANAYKIGVTGKQWMWEFTYNQDGKQVEVTDVMYVPVDTPILLDMTSIDVLHSFYVPSFRVKRDTVPGMKTRVTFTPTKKGDYRIYCAEFCGTSHSRMRGTVRVVSKERFQKWLNREVKEANITDPVELGSRLFVRNCATCHSVGTDTVIGPGFEGSWGSAREFSNADPIKDFNAEYVRESIITPNVKVVKGFPAKMNSFKGLLSEKEIDYLIEYIKTLK